MKSILRMMIIISCVAQAQYRYGTTAANFLEIGTSSNAVGMGEAYVSLAAVSYTHLTLPTILLV